MEEMHEMGGGQMPARETLTAEQHDALAPLVALAALGAPQIAQQFEALKPGDLKRRDLKRRAIEGLREHGTIGHAAAAADVAVSTIYRWRAADPQFDAEVLEFMHVDQVDQLHESMYRIATSTDPKTANAAVQAGKFLLQSLDRRTYGDHLTTEATLTINAQMQVADNALELLRSRQAAAVQQLRTIDAPPSQSDTPALPSTKETP